MVTANSSPFSRLLPYILRYRRRLTIGIGFVFLTTAVSLASPRVLQYAIDDLDDLTTVVTRGRLALYAGLLLSIALIGGGFRFLMRRIVIGVSREIEYDLRNEFFAHLLRLSVGYFHTHRTGDLMSRATSDLSAVRMMVGPAIMYSVSTALVLIVAIIMMLAIDVRLTLIALTPLPLVSLSVWLFGRAIFKRSERIQAQLADMSAIVQETLAGVRVVRAYGREAVELERFRCANQEYVERNRRLIQLQGLFYPSLAFFLGLGAWLVLWLGSRQVILGRITVGEFVAFNAYLVMLSWPMIAFGWVTNMVQRGMASWAADARGARRQALGDRRVGTSRAATAGGCPRARRVPEPELRVQRTPRSRPGIGHDRTWPDARDRGRDRVGEVDVGQPAAAALRAATGNRLH